MNPHDETLELSPDEFRRLVDLAAERIAEHVRTLPAQPSWDLEGAEELAREVPEPIPEEGRDAGELLDLLFDRLIPKSFNTAGPGYLAYIPGGGLLHSAVADLVAGATNRYVGVWTAAPALAQLESTVVAWFCDMIGYPEGSGGVLTTGGSMATLIAIVTARRERLPEDFLDGTIYASDQSHDSVRKSAVLAGFPPGNVRSIPSDDLYRIDVDALARAVREDRDAGRTPFLVVGNAGTTNSGAVDDHEALADLASEEGLWLHSDAAYGGFFVLTERGRVVLEGLSRADSVTVDPHKGLFVPYGTGSLLVRDLDALRRTHAVRADYMPELQTDPEFVDFCEISPELSRELRGLRVWLPIKMHGIGPFRRNLDEKLDLAVWATGELETIPGIEIVARPQLSIVAFRWTAPGLDDDELDRRNRELLRRVNARRRVYLTGTILDGRFVIRICVLSYRTHRDRVEACIEDLLAAVGEIAAEAGPEDRGEVGAGDPGDGGSEERGAEGTGP